MSSLQTRLVEEQKIGCIAAVIYAHVDTVSTDATGAVRTTRGLLDMENIERSRERLHIVAIPRSR